MMIEVTRDDIMWGARRSRRRCPIALAIRRAYGFGPWLNDDLVDVTHGRYYIWGTAPRQLPPTAVHWIVAFDDGAEMAPVSFELTGHEPL